MSKEKLADKTIVIFEDKVMFQNGPFKLTISVTEDRDISGCIARAIEQASAVSLTGVQIDDRR